jgi:hypothetical protein
MVSFGLFLQSGFMSFGQTDFPVKSGKTKFERQRRPTAENSLESAKRQEPKRKTKAKKRIALKRNRRGSGASQSSSSARSFVHALE